MRYAGVYEAEQWGEQRELGSEIGVQALLEQPEPWQVQGSLDLMHEPQNRCVHGG